MYAVSKNTIRSMNDTVTEKANKVLNYPKGISFLADEERGIVTIQYTYKGERLEAHKTIEDFQIFVKVRHRDFLRHYKICGRGEPIYDWTLFYWEVTSQCPGIIEQFLRAIIKF
jgi:hypothetical protein